MFLFGRFALFFVKNQTFILEITVINFCNIIFCFLPLTKFPSYSLHTITKIWEFIPYFECFPTYKENFY